MDVSTVLAAAIVLAHVLGYGLYLRGMRNGAIKPEPVTWTLWVLEGCVNVPTYLQGTEGHWMKDILPVLDLLGSLVIWSFAFSWGRFSRLSREDYSIVATVIAALLAWKIYGDALDANVVLQLGNLISFVPIARNTWRRREVELVAPWAWWSAAYAIDLALVAVNLNSWKEFAFPAACLLTHFTVGAFAFRNNRISRLVS